MIVVSRACLIDAVEGFEQTVQVGWERRGGMIEDRERKAVTLIRCFEMNGRSLLGIGKGVVDDVCQKDAHQVFVRLKDESRRSQLRYRRKFAGFGFIGKSLPACFDQFVKIDFLDENFVGSALKSRESHQVGDQSCHLPGNEESLLNSLIAVPGIPAAVDRLFEGGLDAGEWSAELVGGMG